MGRVLTYTERQQPAISRLSIALSDNLLMQPGRQTYKAIIWETPSSVGKRVAVIAESINAARMKLEAEYGEGTVFDLHSEIDVSTPR